MADFDEMLAARSFGLQQQIDQAEELSAELEAKKAQLLEGAPRAEAAQAAAELAASKLSPLGVESGYAFAFTDETGKTVGGVRRDGTVEFLKFKAPMASILSSMLSSDVAARLLSSSALASVLQQPGAEQNELFAIADQAGKFALRVLPDGSVAFGKTPDVKLGTAQLKSEVTNRLVDTGVGSLLRAFTDEQGGGFGLVDQAGKIVMRVDGTGLLSLFRVLLPVTAALADQPSTPLVSRLLGPGIGSLLQLAPDEAGFAFAVVDQNGKVAFGVPTANSPLAGRRVSKAETADYATAAGNVSVPPITALGDSLTAGAGSNGSGANQGPYPRQLGALNGRAITNMGVGGQGSPAIVARQGGDTALLTVDGNTIPASGAVAVTGRSIQLLTNQGVQSIAGTLNGIEGTLARIADPSLNNYTFTRTAAGAARYCAPDTPFVPKLGVDRQDDTWLIWIGRNDGTGNFATVTEPKVAAAVAYLQHERFLVLGVINKTYDWVNSAATNYYGTEGPGTAAYNQIVAYNNRQAARYGSHFLDIRRLLIDRGLQVAGLPPTADDLADIAQDCIPRTLLSDGLHFVNSGYQAIAFFVNERLTAKGY